MATDKPVMAFSNESHVDVATCAQSGEVVVDHRRRIIEFAKRHGENAANKYLAAMRSVAKIQISKDGKSVLLTGRIDASTPASLARYIGHLKQLKILEVNSLGGNAAAAINVAMVLKELDLTLIVDGYCMSACANYLLTATKRVVLKGGLIGFHGGANACLESLGFFGGIRRLGIRRYMNLTSVAEKERRYLAGANLMTAVIALSQRPDRGAMDGKYREWLLVRPQDVQELGVQDVELISTELFEDVVAMGEASLIGNSHIWHGSSPGWLGIKGGQPQ